MDGPEPDVSSVITYFVEPITRRDWLRRGLNLVPLRADDA